jgi:hypothetical protein
MKAEEKSVARITHDIHHGLRCGEFNALRLIKLADSSQTSCLNWQALELLRTLLFKEQQKYQRSFLLSRSAIQKTQNALEKASDEIVDVTIDKGLCSPRTYISLFLRC